MTTTREREPIPIVLVPPPATVVFSRTTWALLMLGGVLNTLLMVIALRMLWPTDSLTRSEANAMLVTILHAVDPTHYPESPPPTP